MEKRLYYGKAKTKYISVLDNLSSILPDGIFFDNFIQIRGCHSYNTVPMYFYVVEYATLNMNLSGMSDDLEYWKIPRRFFPRSKDDFLLELQNLIDTECYIFTYWNTYHISQYTDSYQRMRVPHDMMIIGYNSDERVFYCSDYFDFNFLSLKKCTYDEIFDAFIDDEYILEGFPINESWRDIYLYRNLQDPAHSWTNPNKMHEGLSQLLDMENLSNPPFYGLYVFESFAEYLQSKTFDFQLQYCNRDIYMGFSFFAEHIRLMGKRAAYYSNVYPLKENDGIIENCNKLANRISAYRNVIRVYNQRSVFLSRGEIQQMADVLKSVKEDYAKVINCLRTQLEYIQ